MKIVGLDCCLFCFIYFFFGILRFLVTSYSSSCCVSVCKVYRFRGKERLKLSGTFGSNLGSITIGFDVFCVDVFGVCISMMRVSMSYVRSFLDQESLF